MKLKTIIIENTWLPGMDHGWGNGYVLLPKDHHLHGKHYNDIDVEVHHGLTFAELVDEHLVNGWKSPDLTKEDIGGWLVGFDTAHYQDTSENWPKEEVQAENRQACVTITGISITPPALQRG